MRSLPSLCTLLLAVSLLASCQSKPSAATPEVDPQEAARMHRAGLVLISDLQHASAWEELIHVKMSVPSRKIEVQAGPGFTTLLIKELKNRADAEGIAQGLREHAEKHPDRFGPTKVEVRLANGPATISPFVLPSAADPGGINPGSVLPTLSLPPLLPSGR